MNRLTFLALAALSLGLTGCSTLYKEPQVELQHTAVVQLPLISQQGASNGSI